MSHGKFGTAINCMDGRTQEPVSKWLKEKYQLDFVDTITEPGIDKIVCDCTPDKIESIKSRVLISVKKHGSKIIAIVGHYDCAGNPVSEEEHLIQIKKAIAIVRRWNLPAEVIGLWVNENWKVELI